MSSNIVFKMDETKINVVRAWLKRNRLNDNERISSFCHSVESAIQEIDSSCKFEKSKRFVEIGGYTSGFERITSDDFNLIKAYSVATGKMSLEDALA